ncbi:MAG TPA: GNAT family N-acetyltransferase [Deltaproteobacteria bacterium]|nr:GNAT family N-acetyltransferase [Deltaproteobacteria bacterium]
MENEEYVSKRVSGTEIQGIIHPGSSMFIETGCAEPQFLVRTLVLENLHLSDVQVYTTIPLHTYSDFGGDAGSRFRIHSFFISPGMSGPFSMGKTDHVPLSSDMLDRMIRDGAIRINTALIHLSPPDENGNMSLGVTVDVVRSVIEKADVVIAQVNRNMPFSCGDSLVHLGEVDYLVEHDEPLVHCADEELDYETKLIGMHVARLVNDGSTIQVGFGRIPDAALKAMKDKHDLSIHSEIITDTVMELVKNGAIPEGKTVTGSLCIGNQDLFRFVDRNPRITMAPLSKITDPQEILSKGPVVAINGAVEIDLTGQSCVALGEQGAHFGALGQPHFNRIAQLTRGGKAIIALRSTSRDGSISRIVPRFTESRMGILTTQIDVSYVVTEYGSVNLFGKSIRERVMELITIAHPRYRSWLLEEAKHMNYIFHDQVLPPEGSLYPAQYEHEQVFGGRKVFIRPVKITDERGVQNLFYSLSNDEKFHRFHIHLSSLHHRQAQNMVNCDYRNSLALVAEAHDGCATSIAAITHIVRDEEDAERNSCEFAVMVHPAWQNAGLGTYLLRLMVDIAGTLGFRVFRAFVWEENVRMLRVFDKIDLPMRASVDCRVVRLDYELDPFPADMDERLPGASARLHHQCVFTENHPLMVYAKNTL